MIMIHYDQIITKFASVTDLDALKSSDAAACIKETMIAYLKLAVIGNQVEITSVLVICPKLNGSFTVYFRMKMVKGLDPSRRKPPGISDLSSEYSK